MDVSPIISKSRIQTNTTVSQKTDAEMLADLNIIYKEIFSRLATKSKKYTWQSYRVNSVANQNEYTIPAPSITDVGIKRLLNVSVKYSSDGDYIRCKMYDTSTLVDSEYENENIPYCIVRDDSIFIYPAIGSVITSGIVVEGQYIPLDLELTTLSAAIKLKSEYHDILITGLNMRGFADKQLFDRQQLMKQQFEEGLLRLVEEGGMDIESGYELENNYIIEETNSFLP